MAGNFRHFILIFSCILATSLWSKYHYSYFKNKKMEVERIKDTIQIIWLKNTEPEFHPKPCLSHHAFLPLLQRRTVGCFVKRAWNCPEVNTWFSSISSCQIWPMIRSLATKMSINTPMGKQSVVYPYNGIFGHKK